jgi:hypothetical protein
MKVSPCRCQPGSVATVSRSSAGELQIAQPPRPFQPRRNYGYRGDMVGSVVWQRISKTERRLPGHGEQVHNRCALRIPAEHYLSVRA